LWRKLGYAVGGLGDSLAFNVISFYLIFYLINVAGVPPIEAGLLAGVPRVLLSPLGALTGPLSDRIRSKWGRRRVFLLICGPLMGSFFFLQFYAPPGLSLSALIVFWWIVQFGLNISMTLTLGAYHAMAAELTSSSAERMRALNFDYRVVFHALKRHGIDTDALSSHRHIDLCVAFSRCFIFPNQSFALKELGTFLKYPFSYPDMDGLQVALSYHKHAEDKQPLDPKTFKYNEDDVKSLPFLIQRVTKGKLKIQSLEN
jgi:hypothetical protein